MMNRKVKTTATVLGMVGILMAGSALAYFTDGDTATNTFTVGKVEIDLQEPNWNPDDVTEITPQEEFAKDPQVKNIGVNDAYVFVEVKVPYATVKTANEDGSLVDGDTTTTDVIDAAKTQLFTWDVNTGWYLVDSDIVSEEEDSADTGFNTYVYAYATEDAETADVYNMTAVAKDVTTGTVFDYVRFANVIEDEGLEETDLNIVVSSYAIQTSNINDEDTDIDGVNNDGKVVAEDVWAVMNTQRSETVLDDKENENEKTDVIETPAAG